MSSQKVTVAVDRKQGLSSDVDFLSSDTLWAVLKKFEGVLGADLTTLQGVPDVEVNEMFEVHINVPGYMQPVFKYHERTIDTNREMKQLSLADLGIGSTTLKATLQLSHKYIAPAVSQEKAQATIERFHRMLMGSQAASAVSRSSASVMQESDVPQRPLIPPRNLKVWRSSPTERKELKPDEDDGEFYDVSEADSQLYAKRILSEAKGIAGKQDKSSKAKSDFKRARIRVRIGGTLCVEATFAATETVGDVIELLRSILLDPSSESTSTLPFYLFLSPPRQVLSTLKRSLSSLGLVPAALVHLAWHVPPPSLEVEDLLQSSALTLLVADESKPNQGVTSERGTKRNQASSELDISRSHSTLSSSRVCLSCGRVFASVTARADHQRTQAHAQALPSLV